MQYTPERMTIGHILSMTNPPILVPDWQRNFSWTTVEVETFWQDLLRFSNQYPDQNIKGEEYFIGAVVIVETGHSKLLLDGQQRIATSAILLSVIRDYLKRFNTDAGVRVSNKYLTDYDDATESQQFKITMNRYDQDFFRKLILEDRGGSYKEPSPTYESHSLILRARKYLESKFEQEFGSIDDPSKAHKWALRILELITQHVSVVAVVSTDEDNAASVFETLNDRGIGLSTTDLLRNLILRRSNAEDQEEVLDLWGEVLEIEGDAKLQDFIRHFWISKEGDIKARGLYRELKTTILDRDINSLTLSRELSDAAKLYQDILSGSYADSDNISQLLLSISSLNAKPLLPAVLSIIQSSDNHDEIIRFLRTFLVLYIRHSLVCKRENSLLENIMFSVARDIRDPGIGNENLIQSIIEFSPNNESFKQNFATVSISRQSSSRFLLKAIEEHLRTTEELEVSSPQRVHVEHIYPQTPLAGNRLENHNALINRLGNLTLLSKRLNQAIKNGPYDAKSPEYAKSELMITNKLPGSFGSWDGDTIAARQAELAEFALEIWKFPE